LKLFDPSFLSSFLKNLVKKIKSKYLGINFFFRMSSVV
jgi:hypothetical protein